VDDVVALVEGLLEEVRHFFYIFIGLEIKENFYRKENSINV
jgi:hypothetical protein